jgi:RNA polymerase sigma-54 factor
MTLKQTQTLSPQMMQSMEILQMGSQELLEYIENLVQENPTVEVEENYNQLDEFNQLKRKLEWLDSTDQQNRYYQQQDREDDRDDPLSNYGTVEESEENLYLYVLSQLPDLEEPMASAARMLVESLNQNGWLDEKLDELAGELGYPVDVLEQALAVVQSLEPAGVGARDLRECLTLQLKRRPGDHALALTIVDRYLDALSKNRFGLIAKETAAEPEEVREACALIKSLNPKPGTGFAARENLTYINPDIIVVHFPDHFELLTNDYFFPTLSISGYYKGLMKETEDREVKEYLTNKVRQAKWVVRSIEQRRNTLMDCAGVILKLQENFFRKGAGHLVPMTLADVAERVGVHESTVSRAIKDKYIQCAGGVYPLSYFFSRGLGASSGGRTGAQNPASPDFAKALLKKLIAEEDRRKPLSDQKLCERMAKEGCQLSRRTVAKYRDELNIPSTTGRKLYDD